MTIPDIIALCFIILIVAATIGMVAQVIQLIRDVYKDW